MLETQYLRAHVVWQEKQEDKWAKHGTVYIKRRAEGQPLE